MHSECLTGDVFGSRRCDCGTQLEASMAAIAAEGRGVVLYLRGHEGRGIGLLSKLRAYQLQDAGADTVDANLELGLPADAREYSTGAQILADLGVHSVRLLTNNPAKVRGLSGSGVKVTGRVALPVASTADNLRYLMAKRDRLGHQIDDLPAGAEFRAHARTRFFRNAPGPERPCPQAGRALRRTVWRGPGERRGAPEPRAVDAAGLSLAIAATRWHAEITDSLVDRAVAAAKACGWTPRWSSGCPGRSSCPWWRPNWPAATTPWPAWAR